MLFGETDPLIAILLGTNGVTLLTVIGGGVVWVLNWRKQSRKDDRAEEDADEETALARLKAVMELREADCNRQIALLTRRVDELERVRDARQIERDAMIEKLAVYAARTKYQDALLRKAGIMSDDWDKPDTAETLPAVNLPPREDK